MKDVLKNVVAKIISVVLILVLLVGGGYYAIKHFANKTSDIVKDEENINIVEILEERLEATAELNTADYICTYVQEYKDQKKIKNWKIPLTVKTFTLSYEGTVKAGIKDLTKTQIEEKGNNIIVKLPKIEITGHEIDKDTLKIYDESHNILNQISVENVNDAQKDLEEEMVKRAEECGLLDNARKNAETVITAMLQSTKGEYTIVIEWQK